MFFANLSLHQPAEVLLPSTPELRRTLETFVRQYARHHSTPTSTELYTGEHRHKLFRFWYGSRGLRSWTRADWLDLLFLCCTSCEKPGSNESGAPPLVLQVDKKKKEKKDKERENEKEKNALTKVQKRRQTTSPLPATTRSRSETRYDNFKRWWEIHLFFQRGAL